MFLVRLGLGLLRLYAMARSSDAACLSAEVWPPIGNKKAKVRVQMDTTNLLSWRPPGKRLFLTLGTIAVCAALCVSNLAWAQPKKVPEFLNPEMPKQARVDPWWVSMGAYKEWAATLTPSHRELLDGVLSNALVQDRGTRSAEEETCEFSGPTISFLPGSRGKQGQLQSSLSSAAESASWVSTFMVESAEIGLGGTSLGTMLGVREVESLKGNPQPEIDLIFFPSAEGLVEGVQYCSHHPLLGPPPSEGDEIMVFYSPRFSSDRAFDVLHDLQFQVSVILRRGDRTSMPKWRDAGELRALSGTAFLGQVRSVIARGER